jgi:hypothetical protein
MTSRPARHGLLLVAALAGATAGACTTPVPTARSADDYTKKAAHTADTARSAVNTATVAITAAQEDRFFGTTLDVVLGEAEDDASGAEETFRAVQPKGDSADAVRARLVPLLDVAVAHLEATRIAARRDDRPALAREVPELRAAADDLDAFTRAVG